MTTPQTATTKYTTSGAQLYASSVSYFNPIVGDKNSFVMWVVIGIVALVLVAFGFVYFVGRKPGKLEDIEEIMSETPQSNSNAKKDDFNYIYEFDEPPYNETEL